MAQRTVSTKVQSCGGNACSNCNKCGDWYRTKKHWVRRNDATCRSNVRTDTVGHPGICGATRTYVTGHDYATGWETIGTINTPTKIHRGNSYGRGVYTFTSGCTDISRGHPNLCDCKKQ